MNEKTKSGVLDALHLLLEIDHHMFDNQNGFVRDKDTLNNIVNRIKEYGMYGRYEYIKELIKEVKDTIK